MKSLLDLPRRKQMAFGAYIGDTDAAICEMACYAGYDYIRIDYEHTLASENKLANLIRICNAADVPSLVRISSLEQITKLLDFGAAGIMVPGVETSDQARSAVEWSKYAPIGKRGMNSASRAMHYGYIPCEEYIVEANKNTVLCVQIESVMGVRNISQIVSLEGVDMVTVGRWDLSQSMGITGQTNHPDIIEAENQVVQAAIDAGKFVMLSANNPAQAKKLMSIGVYCATICPDVQFITKAFNEQLALFRANNNSCE